MCLKCSKIEDLQHLRIVSSSFCWLQNTHTETFVQFLSVFLAPKPAFYYQLCLNYTMQTLPSAAAIHFQLFYFRRFVLYTEGPNHFSHKYHKGSQAIMIKSVGLLLNLSSIFCSMLIWWRRQKKEDVIPDTLNNMWRLNAVVLSRAAWEITWKAFTTDVSYLICFF